MKNVKKDFLSYEKRLYHKILRALVHRIVRHMYVYFFFYLQLRRKQKFSRP